APIQIAEEHRARALSDTDVAARIAVGRLDFDYLGAVVGEHEREIRPRQEGAQVDDAESGELHRDAAFPPTVVARSRVIAFMAARGRAPALRRGLLARARARP